MSSKTYAITLNGVEYIMTARELINISEVITGINPTTAEYTGSAITVSPISEKVLVEGADYSITYSDNISVGNCLVTINGLGNYSGSASFTLEITPVPTVDISEVITGINPTTAEYTGSAITVSPVSEVELVEGVDYLINYSDNISVGECAVTIYGLGSYSGSVNFTLEITEEEPTSIDISEVVTEINPTTAEYTGEPITVVPVSEIELTEGVDYSIEYTDNVSVGECIVTISGIGNYSGTAEFILEITEATNSNSEPENTNNDDSGDSESSENTESGDSTDTNSETSDDTDNSEGSETP